MYQALYRKYRSQTFAEMVGQPVIAKSLSQAVEQDTISHAYLFSGPRGTGKTSAAKIFAKAMNCPNMKDGEPCNVCDICVSITKGSLEDVIEIDAASNNGVDEIRDIRDKSTYAPSLAKHKVYIIDEVHMLSMGAFNALLKTLEEPTQDVVFILATTELHKIPATILSRVQRYEFKAIKTKDIENHLAHILDLEKVGYDPEALSLIARRAEGGMRDALSILDQALSLTQNGQLTLQVAEEITGSISLAALDLYVQALGQGQSQEALEQLDLIFDSGKSMSRFVTDLLHYLRDLLLVQVGGENDHAGQIFEDNLAIPQERIIAMIDEASQALQVIKQSLQAKIHAQVLTLKLAQNSSSKQGASLDDGVVRDLQDQILQLKNKLASLVQNGLPQTPPASKSKPSSPSLGRKSYKVDRNKVFAILKEAVEHQEQSRQNLIKLQNAWGEIIESLSGADKALLIGSKPVAANENHAILSFESPLHVEQTMKRENLNLIFGNILSQAAGFSPSILAISEEEWQEIRTEFANQARGKKEPEEEAPSLIPKGFDFLEAELVIEDN